MTQTAYPQSGRSRLGEVALWSTAALLMLSVHAGAAYYLMQDKEEALADGAPPAAIMIELAALPEAVNTEETVEANDQIETEEVKSAVTQPVDEPLPEEPQPEPIPEPVAEEPPPEPEPPQEITEPVPEELPPEPVQEVDPMEQQQMAALENVEVPLPVIRPPPVEKKVEKEKEPETKRVRKPTRAQQQSEQRDIAKAEATQSDRTAAARSNAGSASSSVSPADWASKVRSAVSRRVARGVGTAGTSVTVAFTVAGDGSIGRVSVRRSTGDAKVDQKIVASVERVSMSAPPPGAQTVFEVPIAFSSRR
ncbi:TonB family protein [Agrobacterium larrymoorei]|uniref:energy transducer TonB family protein n=1 Tax=Agrobacterium larrymoorei TaxID=160699 RepID=UPI001571C6CE|nr:energy transducer TonB [Agrobacterium larrymoorei]NTJ41074.1 TonB family protein [Agrobacterium larrymoorei]